MSFYTAFKSEIKTLGIVLVFTILIIAVGIFTYFLSIPRVTVNDDTITKPSSQPINTSAWQTYRNDEFGFEFQYSPEEWQLMEGDVQEDYGNIVWLFPRDSIGESAEPEIVIAIAHRPLEQEKEKREATSSDLEYNYSKTTIGGRTAYSSALLQGFHGLVREVLIDAGNDQTFIVSSNAIDELDQILSTFRFVEEQSDYVCRVPCTGAAPSSTLENTCWKFTTQEQCTAFTVDESPYTCEWRPSSYQCPPLP
ncbi:MAG TPA: hypothetical protein VFE94_00025 [Candidatus Paceibacterota bacterium]|nr:hypothetical protein [Candidatus Paceibacterota bacterium]